MQSLPPFVGDLPQEHPSGIDEETLPKQSRGPDTEPDTPDVEGPWHIADCIEERADSGLQNRPNTPSAPSRDTAS